MAEQGTIVVGVDGSPGSRSALDFALDEAVLRGAALQVVAAVPEEDHWAEAHGLPQTIVVELAAEAEKTAYAMLADAREHGSARAAVPVEVHVVGGSPASVLVERARAAELLVVGHRGRGAFRSTVLGSVGLQCVLHASVPVTVVRPTSTSDSADTTGNA